MKTIRAKWQKELLQQVSETVTFVRQRQHPHWRTMWEYAIGQRPLVPSALQSRSDIHVYDSNLIWQTILIKNGALTLDVPDFWVHFKRYYPNAGELSALIRSLLRFFWLKGGFQNEIRLADRYARIVGFCPVRVGYEILPNPHVTEEGEEAGEEVLEAESVWMEQPVIRHVSPLRFFFDLDIPVTDLEYARWCCEVLYLTKEQLRALPYRELDEIQPTAKRSDIVSPISGHQREYYEIWSIWDKESGTRILYAPSVPDKVIEIEEVTTPFPGFFPYEIWTIYEIPDYPFAMSEVELLLVPTMTFNYIRTLELNFVSRMLPRFFYRRGSLTPQGQRALEAGSMLQGIEVEADESLSNVIMPFIPSTLPQEMLLMENTLREDITTLSGVTDFHRGVPLPTRRLATEITVLTQLSGIRGRIEQQRFDMFLSKVVSKFYHVLRHFSAEPIVIPVSGINGETQIVAVAPNMLPDDAEVYIVSGGGVVDRAIERREIIELFKFLAQAGLPMVVWIPFIQRLLATFNIHPEEVRAVMEGINIAMQQQTLAQQAELLQGVRQAVKPQGQEAVNTASAEEEETEDTF